MEMQHDETTPTPCVEQMPNQAPLPSAHNYQQSSEHLHRIVSSDLTLEENSHLLGQIIRSIEWAQTAGSRWSMTARSLTLFSHAPAHSCIQEGIVFSIVV